MNEPFEKYIKTLLNQADLADKLRNIASFDTNGNLESTVESILESASLTANFDYQGYDSDERKQNVIAKLNYLTTLLRKNSVPEEHSEQIAVALCLVNVKNGYALTKDIVSYLNKIYSRYA